MNGTELNSLLFRIQLGLSDIASKHHIRYWDNTYLIQIDEPETTSPEYDLDTIQAIVDRFTGVVNDMI